MGTETEGPSGPARIVDGGTASANPYHGPMPLIAKMGLGSMVAFGAIIFLASASAKRAETEAAFAKATEGRCFRTGIGAVGMADWTRRTNVVNLIFPSGGRESYDFARLREVECPGKPAE